MFSPIAWLELGKLGWPSLRAYKVSLFSVLTQCRGGLNLLTSIKISNFFILRTRSLFSGTVTYSDEVSIASQEGEAWLDPPSAHKRTETHFTVFVEIVFVILLYHFNSRFNFSFINFVHFYPCIILVFLYFSFFILFYLLYFLIRTV